MKNIWGSIFLLFYAIGYSQVSGDASIDSLISKAKTFRTTNTDSAIYYSDKAYKIALHTKNVNHIAHSINAKSSFLINKGEFKKAQKLLIQNIDKQEVLDLNQEILGPTYFNLAAISHQIEKRDEAIQYYFMAIDCFLKHNNYRAISRSYLGIGAAYEMAKKQDYANYFYNKSLEFSKKNKNSNAHSGNMKLVSSSDRIKNCLHLLKAIENKETSYVGATIYEDLAEAYYNKADYKNALVNAEKSLFIAKKNKFNLSNENCKFIIASSASGLQNYDKAISGYHNLLQTSEKIHLKSKVLQELISAYENKGDYKNALIYSKRYNSNTDSINAIRENDRIAKITSQFETEKQAQEIQILESDNKLQQSQITNQRNILWASGVGIILLLTSLLFAYKNQKTKRNLQFSELTQKLLQMQLNPHFLFNALNGIQYFIKKNDVKKSTKYISSFSGLMRNILENSVEKFISIQEDHDTIKDFLELQQLVNNNSFSYSIHIDDDLDIENMCIPPMFTQPFVENAIIHGVANLKEGLIEVNYRLKGQTIVVEVIDNGKGIPEVKDNANSLHKSMGTSITKQRMDNLLKMERYPIELEIVSKSHENKEQGTKVVLSFPIKYL